MLLISLYTGQTQHTGGANFAEDIQLWKQLLEGDRNAFSELFRKYYRPLLNYGLKLIPQEELVKDSIQELFFVIFGNSGEIYQKLSMFVPTSISHCVEPCSGKLKYRMSEIKEIRHIQKSPFGKW